MESKKRKRTSDHCRITYHAPNRIFERLFKEVTLDEAKATVRNKLGIPAQAPICLSQLREGKSIELDDDDDFEAFCVLAKSVAALDILVTIGEGQRVSDANPTPPASEVLDQMSPRKKKRKKVKKGGTTVQSPALIPQSGPDQDASNRFTTPFYGSRATGSQLVQDGAAGKNNWEVPGDEPQDKKPKRNRRKKDSGGTTNSAVVEVPSVPGPSKSVDSGRKKQKDRVSESSPVNADTEMPEEDTTTRKQSKSSKRSTSKLKPLRTEDASSSSGAMFASKDSEIAIHLDNVTEPLVGKRKKRKKTDTQRSPPTAAQVSSSVQPEQQDDGKKGKAKATLSSNLKSKTTVPSAPSGVEDDAEPPKKRRKRSSKKPEAPTFEVPLMHNETAEDEFSRLSMMLAKEISDAYGPRRKDPSESALDTGNLESRLPVELTNAKSKDRKESDEPVIAQPNSVDLPNADSAESKKRRKSEKRDKGSDVKQKSQKNAHDDESIADKTQESTVTSMITKENPVGSSTSNSTFEIASKTEAAARAMDTSSANETVDVHSSTYPSVIEDTGKARKKSLGTSRDKVKPLNVIPCPICLGTPFHLRFRCPTIVAGSDAIEKRLEELRKEGEGQRQQLIRELESLLLKARAKQTKGKEGEPAATEAHQDHMESSHSGGGDRSPSPFIPIQAAASTSSSVPFNPIIPADSKVSEVVMQSRGQGSSDESSDGEDDTTDESEAADPNPWDGARQEFDSLTTSRREQVDLDTIIPGLSLPSRRRAIDEIPSESSDSDEDDDEDEDEDEDVVLEEEEEPRPRYSHKHAERSYSSDEDRGISSDESNRSLPVLTDQTLETPREPPVIVVTVEPNQATHLSDDTSDDAVYHASKVDDSFQGPIGGVKQSGSQSVEEANKIAKTIIGVGRNPSDASSVSQPLLNRHRTEDNSSNANGQKDPGVRSRDMEERQEVLASKPVTEHPAAAIASKVPQNFQFSAGHSTSKVHGTDAHDFVRISVSEPPQRSTSPNGEHDAHDSIEPADDISRPHTPTKAILDPIESDLPERSPSPVHSTPKPGVAKRMKNRLGMIGSCVVDGDGDILPSIPVQLGRRTAGGASPSRSRQLEPFEESVARRTRGAARRSTSVAPSISITDVPLKRRGRQPLSEEEKARRAAARLAEREEKLRLRKEKLEQVRALKAAAKAAEKEEKVALKKKIVDAKKAAGRNDSARSLGPSEPSTPLPRVASEELSNGKEPIANPAWPVAESLTEWNALTVLPSDSSFDQLQPSSPDGTSNDQVLAPIAKRSASHATSDVEGVEAIVLKADDSDDSDAKSSGSQSFRETTDHNAGRTPLFFPGTSQMQSSHADKTDESREPVVARSTTSSEGDSVDLPILNHLGPAKADSRPPLGPYRRLTDIASQQTLFGSQTPAYFAPQRLTKTLNQTFSDEDDDDDDDDEDDDDDSESDKEAKSHIPKERRAGISSKKSSGLHA